MVHRSTKEKDGYIYEKDADQKSSRNKYKVGWWVVETVNKADSEYAMVRHNYSLLGKIESVLQQGDFYKYEYDVYLYDEARTLLKKYEYICNEKGDILEVLIYEKVNEGRSSLDWGTTPRRWFYNYPGGEFMDNLLE